MARTGRSEFRARIPRRIVVLMAAALLGFAPAALGDPALEARLSRSVIPVGESATLEVVVRSPSGTPGEPELGLPPGVEILGSGRQQNFSWVNGRSTSENVFRYEIGATAAGRFTLGPFRVRVGAQSVSAPALTLTVTAAPSRLGDAGGGPASLLTDIGPHSPYVGQPVVLRVRLVQRGQTTEGPQYVPPPTPGFWSEPASRANSYFAAEGARRVLVIETRARLYPLAVGRATVGEASATVALAEPSGSDPSQWLSGRVPRPEVTVRSRPITVEVRPLPPGAPAEFAGALGVLSARWTLDRPSTARDVPATVRFEVRGVGNLPLIHTPALESDAVEVFAATVDDSLGAAGSDEAGRRRFQWTVLPRREGLIEIAAPPFAWFDPAAGIYRRADLAALRLDVGPALNPSEASRESYPHVFLDHPLDPFARPAKPWGFGLAGLALGVALTLARFSRRPRADQAERARQREWLRAVGLGRDLDFWRAADEASAWLEQRGRPVLQLRREIAAARYGGASSEPEKVRVRLIEQLSQALPPAAGPLPLRFAATVLILAAAVVCVLFAPQAGEGGAVVRARGADAAARRGDVARARAEWTALWREGSRSPALAARLAWTDVQSGAVGPATVWVLEGERTEPRDPALAWVAERVREGGGLTGAQALRLPVRSVDWAALALLAAALGGALWPRRGAVAALVSLALLAAAADSIESWRNRDLDRAVVRSAVTLEGAGLALEPGQVVRILERSPSRLKVSAGRGIQGLVPAAALYSLEELR